MRFLPNALSTAAAGYGLLAATAGMAAGHLVASLLEPASSPVIAVGATVIELTPQPVASWAIETFGSADKVILVGSVVVVTLLLAAAAGVIARRHPGRGLALLLALVAAAGVAALTRPAAGLLAVVPAIVTAVVGAAVLRWTVGRLRQRATGADAPGSQPHDADDGARRARPSRRGLLIGSGIIAVAAVAAGAAGQVITTVRTRISDLVLPTPAEAAPALPTGLDDRIDGLSPFRTPLEDFYRVDINLTVPVVDQESWSLTIDGDVDEEVTFSYDELLEMDMVERNITLNCVSNIVGGPLVSSQVWQGIPLPALLDRAGISGTGADQVLSTSVDGFTMSTPLEAVLDGRDAMLVLGIGGEPLPRERGFPARLLTPGLYGYVGACKWVERLTLTTYDEQESYWTERGWETGGEVKVQSRIDTPEGLSRNSAGEIVVAGVAWAQTRGIERVQVRIDGGAWQDAELGPDANISYWRQWFYRWDATETGQHAVAVRAITQDGETQTAVQADVFPGGASGIHEIQLFVD